MVFVTIHLGGKEKRTEGENGTLAVKRGARRRQPKVPTEGELRGQKLWRIGAWGKSATKEKKKPGNGRNANSTVI